MNAAVEDARRRLAEAARTLRDSGARTEALAVYEPAGRGRFFARRATFTPIGRVWRLGALLVDDDARLFGVGEVISVAEPGRPQNLSTLAEQRRELRSAALRAGYPRGETVNFDATPIPLDADRLSVADGPVRLADGRLLVRWAPGAAELAEFTGYVDERVRLLAHPPEGA